MTSEEYEEDQRALLLEARNAIRRVEYLLELLSYLLLYCAIGQWRSE